MSKWICPACGKVISYCRGDSIPKCTCKFEALPDLPDEIYPVKESAKKELTDFEAGLIASAENDAEIKAVQVDPMTKRKRHFKGGGLEVTKNND